MEKLELVVQALQQRIGEIVSNYETQIAILRAEFTQVTQAQEEKTEAIREYEDSLSI